MPHPNCRCVSLAIDVSPVKDTNDAADDAVAIVRARWSLGREVQKLLDKTSEIYPYPREHTKLFQWADACEDDAQVARVLFCRARLLGIPISVDLETAYRELCG